MDNDQTDHPAVWGRKACEGLKQASTEQLEAELKSRRDDEDESLVGVS